ncbi:unnamed protein product [Aphanomyces euteiches]
MTPSVPATSHSQALPSSTSSIPTNPPPPTPVSTSFLDYGPSPGVSVPCSSTPSTMSTPTLPSATTPSMIPTPFPSTPVIPSPPSVDSSVDCPMRFDVPSVDACSDKNLPKGGWAPISVRGMHRYCTQVTEARPRFCVANIKGNCPVAQPGLPLGSECKWLEETKVFGCVPRSTCSAVHPSNPKTGCDLVQTLFSSANFR